MLSWFVLLVKVRLLFEASVFFSGNTMAKVALKVVKKPDFFEETVSFHGAEQPGTSHSLHYAMPYAESFAPEVPEYFLNRYTQKGDVVLDPFCGGGTTLLSANLLGRVAYGSDLNPLALAMSEAKVTPSDLTEVTLGLQSIDLRQPINIKVYSEYFAPFFDVDTFREISNLKNYFARNKDRIARFIRFMSLSLLHGPSAGYFSVPTHATHALSPEEQDGLNIKRRQIPDYRAVLPRILKKTASALRDGYPGIAEGAASRNKLALADARDLYYVPTGGVDTVITTPPAPGTKSIARDQWLKLWFLGENVQSVADRLFLDKRMSVWKDFMNESLLEMARVVRPGGRAIMAFAKEDCYEEVLDLVNNALGRYWSLECVLHDESTPLDPRSGEVATRDCIRRKGLTSQERRQKKYLVLRRW